jgi:hypothetical protein
MTVARILLQRSLDGSGDPLTFLLALALLIGLPLVVLWLGKRFDAVVERWR